MKYQTQLEEAFKFFGYTPRPNQMETCNSIITSFLDDGIKYLILNAPTGTGKSIIGAVVAEVVHSIKSPNQVANASFLVTPTIALQNQYVETFKSDNSAHDHRVVMIMGASNYSCSALSTQEEPQTADGCAIRVFQKSGMEQILTEDCSHCAFQLSRQKRDKARHLILNTSYYFTDRLAAEILAPRTVCVFDEAHLLNDLYTDHCAINFTEKGLLATAEEVTAMLTLGNSEIFKHLKFIGKQLANEKITDNNYIEMITLLASVYTTIAENAEQEAERNIRNRERYLKINKMTKKYFGRAGKILDLLEHEYPHVFEYKKKDVKSFQSDHEVTIKPIFIGKMFEKLVNAEHNLLMSATISEQYAKRTLQLDPSDKVCHIRLPPQFPIENKKVVFFKPMSLNYNSMKDPESVKKLCVNAFQIVKHHSDKGERGIILAPSFAIVESIAGTLRGALDPKEVKVFEHVRGEKLIDWIEAFKAYDKGPAVFLTPSGFEGLDLPQDLSRYQILVKTPWGALGDKRIKLIADVYPDIYAHNALAKLTQGAGRSVRSIDDYATTYILDQAAQRLWCAKTNMWANEFEVSFKSIL